jgi:hypothetical protein
MGTALASWVLSPVRDRPRADAEIVSEIAYRLAFHRPQQQSLFTRPSIHSDHYTPPRRSLTRQRRPYCHAKSTPLLHGGISLTVHASEASWRWNQPFSDR